MPIIQIAKNQDSYFWILLNMARIAYILLKFTVYIVLIDSNLSYYIWSKNHANL
jgi:hypothetical protein